MFAEPPPAAPPALTSTQRSDLECLSIGFVLSNSIHSGIPSSSATRLVRVYLGRLRSSDPSQEWLQMILPDSQMSYGWFLSRLRDCERPFHAPPPTAPTQATPTPPSSATPVGG